MEFRRRRRTFCLIKLYLLCVLGSDVGLETGNVYPVHKLFEHIVCSVNHQRVEDNEIDITNDGVIIPLLYQVE